MREEVGDEVECWIDPARAIEHHRVDGFPHGEVAHFRALARRVIEDVTHATCVDHTCDKAEVIQDWAMVRGLVGPNRFL